ncbi:hypothetical protein [Streptomyces chryseus]
MFAATATASGAQAAPEVQPPTGWKMHNYLFPDRYTDTEGDTVQ